MNLTVAKHAETPDNEELCKRKERIAAYRKARP